ncbi:MAG: hypothetical protein ACRYFV_13760 [Janthinobacterium lividum]
MRDILKPIETTNALGALFNAYMRGLSTPAIMCDPCYTTMAEVKEIAEGTMKRKMQKFYKRTIHNYYALTVLRNSLRDIHDHVVGAIAELEAFFAEYGADFTGYAADKRVKGLLENGSDNDEEAKTDWYKNNEADENEEWKAVRKTDPESLKHYTLHNEMGWYFGSAGAGRGEYIGTSTPHDFEPYSTLVSNQSAFSFRKFMEHFAKDGKTPEIRTLQADGTLAPMSLGDQVEHEIRKDIQGEEAVLYFSVVLGMCVMIRERYLAMQPEDLAMFQTMHGYLLRVRDLDFPADFLRARADIEEAKS